MIYLQNITEEQPLFIPKEGRKAEGRLLFKAWSTINLSGFVTEVTDLNTSVFYYRLSITLAETVPAGEYEYELSDGGGVLATGLLVIGDLENPIEYNKVTEYEQYEN